MYDSFGLPKHIEVTRDSEEHVFPANTQHSQVVHRPWFNIYPLTFTHPKMRVERFSHKANALSFITKEFSSYHVHIERNFDLDAIYFDEGKGNHRLVSEWIHNLRWSDLVTGHKCVPDSRSCANSVDEMITWLIGVPYVWEKYRDISAS